MSVAPQKLKSVLIVEDEADICLILNIMLHNGKMDLQHAKNIADAKSLLSKSSYDLVVLDNKLPDGWGAQFIPYIKEHCPDSKILMISGIDNTGAALADAFISKPFTKQQIFDSVEKLLV